MPKLHSYYNRRKMGEATMAADAASSVARIAHSELAVLHGKSADRAATALACTAVDRATL